MEIPADSDLASEAGRDRHRTGRFRLSLTTAGFAAALLIFVGVSSFGYLSTRRLLEAATWRAHTEDAIGEIRGLLAALLDAEASMRGFVITGDARFLDRHGPAVGESRNRLETLRSLVKDHPGQRQRLDDVEPLVADRLRSVEAIIALRRDRGQGAAAAAIDAVEGKGLSDRLRLLLAEMEAEERRLLVGRQRRVESSTFMSHCALFGGGAVSVTLLVGIVLALQREIRERSGAEDELRKAQLFLDSIVENIPDMIFVKEAASLRFVRFNRAGEALLGFPRKDLIGKSDYDFFPKDQADFFTAKDRDVLNGGTLLDIPEEPIRTRDEHAGPTLDEQGRKCVNRISASARRMAKLIDDLLEFARMGRAEFGRARVPLGPLVRGVRCDLESEAEGRRITWRIASLPTVEGDRAMLRLVFTNLISNALKYTRPKNEAQIEIGARIENGETVIFVRDNGVGFSMEYAPRLFGVFQRLHRQEDFEGTGIGLANVRRIIHRHGGRTWAEAEVDRGVVFYFSLPEMRESA